MTNTHEGNVGDASTQKQKRSNERSSYRPMGKDVTIVGFSYTASINGFDPLRCPLETMFPQQETACYRRRHGKLNIYQQRTRQ